MEFMNNEEKETRPISLVPCSAWDYEYTAVKEALRKTFDQLGGIKKFVNRGDKILLKVNLVMKKAPEAAATSHPVFVQALAELLIEQGAEVIIGDSPGGPFNEMRLKAVYQGCGMKEAAEKSGASLNFNTKSSEVSNPKGLILKRLTNIDILREVDKVINVSRLKTHGMMKMTGAVKNLFGTVPGTMKAEYHLNRPEPEQFADALIDICICAAPILSFIDGVVAMEGDGPTSGTPRRVGLIMASEDPFALDLAAARVINTSPQSIPTVRRAIERGLCLDDYRRLNYVNYAAGPISADYLDQFVVTDFKAPAVKLVNPLSADAPRWVRSFVNHYGQPRPIFIHDTCIGCRDCEKNCPPGAITMLGNREEREGSRGKSAGDLKPNAGGLGSSAGGLRPEVDLQKCIRCFCCQELCPKKAVEIKRPWLFQIMARL